jgi:hypothetical protein
MSTINGSFFATGQRYGYNVRAAYGYNYITGGGGIILNRYP